MKQPSGGWIMPPPMSAEGDRWIGCAFGRRRQASAESEVRFDEVLLRMMKSGAYAACSSNEV